MGKAPTSDHANIAANNSENLNADFLFVTSGRNKFADSWILDCLFMTHVLLRIRLIPK